MRRAPAIFALVVAVQVAYPVAVVGWNEIQLSRGYEVRLQTVPVDPRDLFRGDYVVLRYEISSVYPEDYDLAPSETTAYVGLRKNGPRFSGDSATTEKPDGMPFIRGRIVGRDQERGRLEIDYGIERYYVPEGEGLEYERAEFLYVDVKLDRNGKARIADVIIPRGP